jgi:hypothetical protein
MTATLFVNGGDEYIRVATSVPKPDGSGRAIGTVPAGPVIGLQLVEHLVGLLKRLGGSSQIV